MHPIIISPNAYRRDFEHELAGAPTHPWYQHQRRTARHALGHRYTSFCFSERHFRTRFRSSQGRRSRRLHGMTLTQGSSGTFHRVAPRFIEFKKKKPFFFFFSSTLRSEHTAWPASRMGEIMTSKFTLSASMQGDYLAACAAFFSLSVVTTWRDHRSSVILLLRRVHFWVWVFCGSCSPSIATLSRSLVEPRNPSEIVDRHLSALGGGGLGRVQAPST